MRASWFAPAAAVVLVAALLTACGSDDTVVDLDGPDATAAEDGGALVDATFDVDTDADASGSDGASDSAIADAGAPPLDASADAARDASPCQPDQVLCGTACTDLQTDETSCGACGHACDAGTACDRGACAITCGAGLTACDGRCIDLDEDPANCGTCGKACATEAHESAVCVARVCAEVCASGYADCDLKASNGCEVQLATSAKDCGLCGHVCPGGDVCVASKCVRK